MLKSNLSSVCIALCFTLSSYSLFAQSVATTETAPSVITAKNKATALQTYALFNDRKLEDLSKLYAEDYVSHTNSKIKGREGVISDFTKNYKYWPDVKVIIEQIVAEGDWVMIRSMTTATHSNVVMGVQPTQKTVEVVYWDVQHYNKEGLIFESWTMLDNASLMQQLGLLPAKK